MNRFLILTRGLDKNALGAARPASVPVLGGFRGSSSTPKPRSPAPFHRSYFTVVPTEAGIPSPGTVKRGTGTMEAKSYKPYRAWSMVTATVPSSRASILTGSATDKPFNQASEFSSLSVPVNLRSPTGPSASSIRRPV